MNPGRNVGVGCRAAACRRAASRMPIVARQSHGRGTTLHLARIHRTAADAATKAVYRARALDRARNRQFEHEQDYDHEHEKSRLSKIVANMNDPDRYRHTACSPNRSPLQTIEPQISQMGADIEPLNFTSSFPAFYLRSSALSAVKLRGLAFLFPALFTAVLGAATIEGKVTLAKTRATPVVNQRYEIVASAGVLSTNPPVAIVYLAGSFSKPATPAVAQITQKDLTFSPSLLPVQAGTKVEFPNFDDTYHNIFSFSPPKRFDLGRYRSDERPIPSQIFEVPGLVTLRCDIHEHMRALILVLDTPHFVITSIDGSFSLSGLPAGRYILKAWVDSKTTREQTVELASDSALRVDFP